MTAVNYIYIIVSAPLLGFLIWKELSRANRSRLLFRIVASILSVTSLALIAIRPSIKTNQQLFGEAIYLSRGFNNDSVESFLKNKNPKSVVIQENDFYQLLGKNFATIHVFGYGLKKEQLDELKQASIVFHPSTLPEGTASIYWTQKIKRGEDLHVQGRFHRLDSEPVKIILGGSGRQLDSTILVSDKQDFSLVAKPHYEGRGGFVLTALKGKDTLQQEIIPVEIASTEALRILILASSPDFENKFLSNWLSKNGSKVMVRTAISRGKFSQAFLNVPTVSMDKLSPALMKDLDLVIADAAELTNLSGTEITALRSQIEENGLGLLIRADTSIRVKRFYNDQFPSIPASVHSASGKLKFFNVGSISAPQINSAIRFVAGTQPLIKDEKENILVNSAILGSGKLVYTTLTNTYSLQLSGDSKSYSAIWSLMLQKSARKKKESNLWYDATSLNREQQPINLYASGKSVPGRLSAGDVPVRPVQDFWLPNQWTGTFNPKKSGWQMFNLAATDTGWMYVFPADSWMTHSVSKTIEETKKRTDEEMSNMSEKESIFQVERQPVPLWYFFIIFILSTAFLWIEKKLLG